MKRHAVATVGFAAVIALGLGGYGCSSSSNGSGSGGSGGKGGTAGGGQGGAGGGQGGSAGGGHGGTSDGGGQGGATDAAQETAHDASTDALASCNPAPVDQSACNSNPSCAEACGLNIAAISLTQPQRTCTCSGSTASGGKWSCPTTAGSCVYPTDVDLTCFHLPTPLPLCPKDTTTDAGLGLIRPGMSPCTVPNSETCGNPCGSATAGVFSYQNGSGAGQVGYCACVAGTYQCASVNEWPAP